MAADATQGAVVATASAAVGAMFGLTLDATGCGLAGSLLGLTFVREPIGPARSMIQFAMFGVGGALFATWATHVPATRDGLAFLAAFLANPAARILWSRAEQYLGPTFDRIFGTKSGAKKR